ncbi:MAG: PAS domain-containing protein [Spirochaetales bacterium]|nr:PAS domain-containing protein [Spirochaetales bacterium]
MPFEKDQHNELENLLGLGDFSARKSYYPELQLKIKELDNAKDYITSIINSMPSVIIGLNSDFNIVHWNNTAEVFTGKKFQDVEQLNIKDIFPMLTDELDKIKENVSSHIITNITRKPIILNNKRIIIDITIFPLDNYSNTIMRIDDVTERIKLEEVLIQNEKMLSVGGLAAGMAHEILNPLGGILQTAYVIQNRIGEKSEIPANKKAAKEAGTTVEAIGNYLRLRGITTMIDRISESGKRISAIVDNILSFARTNHDIRSRHNLNDLLHATLKLSLTDYNMKKNYDFKHVKIIKHFSPDLPSIPCEESKIQQVLLNILRNAAEAMHESNIENPEIEISTGIEEPIRMAVVEIRDNGPGISEEIKKRVFEPFFTTKPSGMGTGLGLSISYFIIKENHGGELIIESEPGRGTKFIIKLPLD